MYTAFNNSKHRTFSEEQVDVELYPVPVPSRLTRPKAEKISAKATFVVS
jgi:hypothetical protein